MSQGYKHLDLRQAKYILFIKLKEQHPTVKTFGVCRFFMFLTEVSYAYKVAYIWSEIQ